MSNNENDSNSGDVQSIELNECQQNVALIDDISIANAIVEETYLCDQTTGKKVSLSQIIEKRHIDVADEIDDDLNEQTEQQPSLVVSISTFCRFICSPAPFRTRQMV